MYVCVCVARYIHILAVGRVGIGVPLVPLDFRFFFKKISFGLIITFTHTRFLLTRLLSCRETRLSFSFFLEKKTYRADTGLVRSKREFYYGRRNLWVEQRR